VRARIRPAFALPLVLAAIARAEPSADPAPDLSPPVATADRLLAGTASAAEAARAWLREHLSNQAVSGYASGATAAVTDRFERALDDARAAHDRSMGVFLFDPARDPDHPWRRPADAGAVPARLVLLIHGLDEGGTVWSDLAPALHAAGHAVARFNYPNDQPIAASADALAIDLRALESNGVRRVDFVGHSMGGLVARDLLTRPGHYAGLADAHDGLPDVGRLVMLGTPNRGAPLAPLRAAMEVRDQFVRWLESDDKAASHLLGFMVDGEGEAGADLTPGSPFLADLNARPAPRGVDITIILARVGDTGRSALTAALDSAFVRSVVGESRADAWKAGAGGVFEDLGDGVVPEASARLPGVPDTVVVGANHRSMICSLRPVAAVRDALRLDPSVPPALPIVLDRLSREPGATPPDPGPPADPAPAPADTPADTPSS
jgi:pimeloyl-ACP methyl ester carboxylesterase